jgi:hypothetical protein
MKHRRDETEEKSIEEDPVEPQENIPIPQYDVGYNLTEEIRQLLDSDYKKDVALFEVAKKHILLLLNNPNIEDDTKEYTDMKEKLLQDFYKAIEDRLKGERNQQTVAGIGADYEAFINMYNGITVKYMEDTIGFLMKYVNRKQ